MPKIPRSSQAIYDSDGNIVLLATEKCIPIAKSKESAPPKERDRRTPEALHAHGGTHLIGASLAEGRRQMHATREGIEEEMKATKDDFRQLPKKFHSATKRLWNFAKAPLRLPGALTRKPRTKTGMFFVDTIRFGGTFALIFGVLFVGINYQSFWQIARAQLALGTDIKTEQALKELGTGMHDTGPVVRSSGVRGTEPQNIRKYLPATGPYEDRLVIPKLGKNIPIIRPGMEALMKENWKQFEEDIQAALQGGVVHYPGSARPGQAGNFFVTGHSSYYPWAAGNYKEVFARLNELSTGDTYSVYYGGDRHAYRVTKKYEVRPSDVSVLDQPMDKRLSTLMTCTPVGTTLRRLIVQAEEIDPVTGETLKVGEKIAERSTNPFTRLEALPI